MNYAKTQKLDHLARSLQQLSVLDQREISNCIQSVAKGYSNSVSSSLAWPTVSKILFAQKLRFLCMLDSRRTCAGCCDDFTKSRGVLLKKYRGRRNDFLRFLDCGEDLFEYKKYTRENEQDADECPFLAFLDECDTSIGCLLHPHNKTNRGIEFRNYGKYGADLCSAYVCSAIKTLESIPAKTRVIFLYLFEYSDDWYHYSRLFSPSVRYTYRRGVIEILLHFLE